MSSPIPCLEILERRRQEGLFRERRVISGYSGRWMEMDGRALIDFTRNDYLDISNHADLIDAFKQCTGKFGMGSGGSQFLGGYTSAHQRLEEELAEFLQRDRAILFSSGYLANLAAVSAMCKRNETVLADRFVHASLIDAARLAGVRLKRYAHCAPAALEAILTGEAAGKPHWVLTEGVFSMEGDIAPLPELAEISERHGLRLIVDDAHGLGVLGHNGAGTLEHFGLEQERVPLLIGGFGKAFGLFGAFVAGSNALIETILQTAESAIYTTAPPPGLAAAASAALRLIRTESWRRQRLSRLIALFQQCARDEYGLPVSTGQHPIQTLVVGDNNVCMEIAQELLDAGFWVSAIRPPTVPQGSARLRISLSVAHEEEDLRGLSEALARVCRGRLLP